MGILRLRCRFKFSPATVIRRTKKIATARNRIDRGWASGSLGLFPNADRGKKYGASLYRSISADGF
jgi:hypothetical protein